MNELYKLPDGWKWVIIKDVLKTTQSGIWGDEIFDAPNNEIYPIIRSTEIDHNGKIMVNDKIVYRRVKPEKAKKYFLKQNDLLIVRSGGTTGKIILGRVGIYNGEPDKYLFSNFLLKVQVDENIILSEFLWYYLNWKKFLEENIPNLIRQTTGIQNLPIEDYFSIKIPLPPLSEQKRIVEKIKTLMDDIEKAKNACEKQIEAAEALFSAYLREIFESEEAKKWERKKLNEACEYNSGIWGDEPDNSNNCYFILRSNNIKDGKMIYEEIAIRKINSKYVEEKSLKLGDILVTTSSGSKDLLGKSAIFIPPDDKTYLFSNFTMRLRSIYSIVNYFYLYFYLQSPQAKKVLQLIQDTTTGLRNLDRKEFLNQYIPLPPLKTQQRIVNYLKEKLAYVENLKSKINDLKSTIDALPQSILKKAFKGEL